MVTLLGNAAFFITGIGLVWALVLTIKIQKRLK